MQYQDHPSRFLLLVARILGFIIAAVFLLFMVPEFIEILTTKSNHNELWIFVFYLLSLIYGIGFLISYWNLKISAYTMIICSILISIYGFIDTMDWVVLLILLPLSFSGILFLIYVNKTTSQQL